MSYGLEDAVEDLKEFITATVKQETTDLRAELQHLDIKLTKKIDDLSASVAEAMEAGNEAVDNQLQDHERRITRLEHKAA